MIATPKPMRREDKPALTGPSVDCDALVVWAYYLGARIRCTREPIIVEEGYSLCKIHDTALNHIDLHVMKANSGTEVKLFMR